MTLIIFVPVIQARRADIFVEKNVVQHFKPRRGEI